MSCKVMEEEMKVDFDEKEIVERRREKKESLMWGMRKYDKRIKKDEMKMLNWWWKKSINEFMFIERKIKSRECSGSCKGRW